jgi:putative acetyltransferase
VNHPVDEEQATVSPEPLNAPDSRRLLRTLDDYLNGLYHPDENFLDLPAEDVSGGRGTFLVARQDGVAVGCGAVRCLSPTTGEVKRMFVDGAVRGGGLGRRILAELEAWAAAAGLTRLVLEAGDRQTEAIRFYERSGFSPIPCFGEYADAPLSRCFEKQLTPHVPKVTTNREKSRNDS